MAAGHVISNDAFDTEEEIIEEALCVPAMILLAVKIGWVSVSAVLLLLLSTVDAHKSAVEPLSVAKVYKSSGVISRLKRSKDESDLTNGDLSAQPASTSDGWNTNHLSSIELMGASSEVGEAEKRGDRGRLMDRFQGMRGKKDEIGVKRAPADGFFGMRGKKYSVSDDVKRWPGETFYGMRGKKRSNDVNDSQEPHESTVLGVTRGEGTLNDGNEAEDDLINTQNDNKRDVNNRFFGMRGKKSPSSPPYVVRIAGDDGNEGNFRLLLSKGGELDGGRNAGFRVRENTFYRNLLFRKPSYLDRKRQVGNVFFGMRG